MLAVKLSPKASRNAVLGWQGETLKLAVTAAPERGKANAAARALLAEVLGVAKSTVVLRRGETDSHKQFEISGLSDGEILRRLAAHVA